MSLAEKLLRVRHVFEDQYVPRYAHFDVLRGVISQKELSLVASFILANAAASLTDCESEKSLHQTGAEMVRIFGVEPVRELMGVFAEQVNSNKPYCDLAEAYVQHKQDWELSEGHPEVRLNLYAGLLAAQVFHESLPRPSQVIF